MKDSPAGILARYDRVLEVLADAADGVTLTEVVRRTSLKRSTAHRLLGALCEVGYGRKLANRTYVVGSRLLHLIERAQDDPRAVAAEAAPLLDALARGVGETAFLARLADGEVRTVVSRPPPDERQAHVHPGRLMPPHAAASAKAILAFGDEAALARVLAEPLARFTDRTCTDPDGVRGDFARVRERGYAACVEELDPGVLSYAVPVRRPGTSVRYSLGVVGLARRLGERSASAIVDALRDAADSLARQMSAARGDSSGPQA